MKRRIFLKRAALSTATFAVSGAVRHGGAAETNEIDSERTSANNSRRETVMATAIRKFLDKMTYTREEVDRFLDPDEPNWAVFDSELGYTLRSNVIRDGVDGSYTISNYSKTGERKTINYAEGSCRINTYGNSFTQCHQVSDGETWQEYLAAHLGEPIRNFGIGGYGVYQAYRRMLRTEAVSSSAEYLVLNIWGVDDHFRSLDRWRWLRIGELIRNHAPHLFHAHTWAHVRIDPETGNVVEHENPHPTPESIYQLCDKEYVYETFKDDIMLHMFLAQREEMDVDIVRLKKLARTLGVNTDFRSPETRREAARELQLICGFRATMYIVEKAQAFADKAGKKLMILLSYAASHVQDACANRPRFDRPFVEFLKMKNILFVDTLSKHVEDFQSFNLSPEEYTNRHYVGHYNPKGNHFFAFAIKDAIVSWLNPKPIAYQEGGTILRFEEYLQYE